MNESTVHLLAEGYVDLVMRQREQEDFPYDGSPYFASEGACDERWSYWNTARQWADEDEISAAVALCNGF